MQKKIKFYYQTLLAVANANNEGVIHRDLKPENILVTDDDEPRVSDFGICFIDEQGKRDTLSQEAVGSFRYMAPELEDGKSDLIGPHSDVYSLGKLAYWLFSGGTLYNRERHRDPDFNLATKTKEHWVHFLNDFLDDSTNPDISRRIKDVPTQIIKFDTVRQSMTELSRYLSVSVEQGCAFCKRGIYRLGPSSLGHTNALDVKNFGVTPYTGSEWQILVCDTCGNVQLFRKDQAPKWSWK